MAGQEASVTGFTSSFPRADGEGREAFAHWCAPGGAPGMRKGFEQAWGENAHLSERWHVSGVVPGPASKELRLGAGLWILS